MDFRYVHIYRNASGGSLDVEDIAQQLAKLFPSCELDVRPSFFDHWSIPESDAMLEKAMISDPKHPFERQPAPGRHSDSATALYDGFILCRLLGQALSEEESESLHVHVAITHLVVCTFSEEDWRYHSRALICGTPSIISSSGIVEAPAKPREFYYPAGLSGPDASYLRKQLAARFIDHDDERLTTAAAGYALQALFYFITDGEPFCENRNCRLYNSHWQEDLIRTQVENPNLCSGHQEILENFNKGPRRRSSF